MSASSDADSTVAMPTACSVPIHCSRGIGHSAALPPSATSKAVDVTVVSATRAYMVPGARSQKGPALVRNSSPALARNCLNNTPRHTGALAVPHVPKWARNSSPALARNCLNNTPRHQPKQRIPYLRHRHRYRHRYRWYRSTVPGPKSGTAAPSFSADAQRGEHHLQRVQVGEVAAVAVERPLEPRWHLPTPLKEHWKWPSLCAHKLGMWLSCS